MRGTRVVPIPGDGLLHPIVAAAVAVLLVNDHVLKAAFPGLVTGKLSDLAGLLFFPLLIVAAWEVLASLSRPWGGPRLGPLVVATFATASVFAAVKLSTEGAFLYAESLGWMQWIGATLVASVIDGPTPRLYPVAIVRDPTDLVALVAVLAALAIGLRRINHTMLLEGDPP